MYALIYWFHGIPEVLETLGLEGTFKTTQLQTTFPRQKWHPLHQAAQGSIQPWALPGMGGPQLLWAKGGAVTHLTADGWCAWRWFLEVLLLQLWAGHEAQSRPGCCEEGLLQLGHAGPCLQGLHREFQLTAPAQGPSAGQAPFLFKFPALGLRNKDSNLLIPAEKWGKEEW